MAQFQVISLDEEDMELIARIIQSVPKAKSFDGAVKWALKTAAAGFAVADAGKKTAAKAGAAKTRLHLDLDTHSTLIAGLHLPLDTHRTFSIAQFAKGTGNLKHTVLMANETFDRLAPDKATRVKLLGRKKI